ncbi:CheR family methyltransferase [Desulfoferrobacter suflitae]|uniref:CheR family methyltransferase n=1 Tax=Desulfoferrobacter suflitae TaxID=2865782 RepID=UPI002164824B|nr:protein-glutamate O-methyltransferase CheR [Desulfoferrobacter suflitae]MCK8602835.1 protein-glutamate O-methyltransferase CheR [Desulfoferrobacter suflitae]
MYRRATQERDSGIESILDYLMEKRGFDFSGYHPAMLERRIGHRMITAHCSNYHDYLAYVKDSTSEMDQLLDAITINVSRFFRDTLTFEVLAERILPFIVHEKIRLGDRSLRIWSAGCAMGEEPYSVAILIHELLCREELVLDVHIFATDIDARVLKDALRAVYPVSSVDHIKYRLLIKYFTQEGGSFRLVPEIRQLVTFSLYDMLDTKHCVPPESIFGNFDLVFCRNLLIYFNPKYQQTIFAKLHHALARNGYLILGEAEAPTLKYQRYFSRVLDFSPIYRKR